MSALATPVAIQVPDFLSEFEMDLPKDFEAAAMKLEAGAEILKKTFVKIQVLNTRNKHNNTPAADIRVTDINL